VSNQETQWLKKPNVAKEQRKAALQALFKAMLHQLMSGQLRLPKSGSLPKPCVFRTEEWNNGHPENVQHFR
jgi:hypothetical protein